MFRWGTLMALAAVVLGFALVRPTQADDKKDTKTTLKGDALFVWNAGEGGMMEVKLGKLATDHAANADVKTFGERMVTDHSRINKELQTLADKRGFKIPTELNKKDLDTFNQLKNLKAKDFDAAYIKDMVKDHETDVQEFMQQSKEAKNQDVREFASKTLPILQDHLRLAKKVASKLNGK